MARTPTFYGTTLSKAPMAKAVTSALIPGSVDMQQSTVVQAAAPAVTAVAKGQVPGKALAPLMQGKVPGGKAVTSLFQQMASPVPAVAQAAAATLVAGSKKPKVDAFTAALTGGSVFSAGKYAPSAPATGAKFTGRGQNIFASTTNGTPLVTAQELMENGTVADKAAAEAAALTAASSSGGSSGGYSADAEEPMAEAAADESPAQKALAWLKEPVFGLPRGVWLGAALGGGVYFWRR